MNTELIQKTRAFVEQLFREKIGEDYRYHNLEHTESVVAFSEKFGRANNLNDTDLETLIIAAYLHDTGYSRVYIGHEHAGMEIAAEFLPTIGVPKARIEQIQQLIEATIPPLSPRNLMESIIKDADLTNLGMENFFTSGDALRYEWEHICGEKHSEAAWYQGTLDFVDSHEFYTDQARGMFGAQKKVNRHVLQQRLERAMNQLEKPKKKKKKKGKKKKSAKKEAPTAISSSRSAQMMFKTALRNHIDLTNIADNKSNMMLSISTIVISITIPLVASEVAGGSGGMELVIPAVLLLVTCMLSIVFATLATRPIKMTGLTNVEQIKQGGTNLFFFGNFYKMNLPQYKEGILTTIEEEEVLEGTIINDLYYLGKALGKKYNYLRTCYAIFMAGIVTTVIAFAIMFIMTHLNA